MISAGNTLAVTLASHAGRTIALNSLTGSVCTLPVATGSGAVYKFVVSVLATSNSHVVKVADASGLIKGVIHSIDTDTGDAVASWGSTSTSDTITLNRSTTGSVYVGEEITITDVATNVFSVRGWFAATGAPATPFSATV